MQLNFKEYGQGPPVIILHGLLGSLDNWQSIAKELSRSYRVIAVDLRNHGRSPHHPEMTFELMAADLLTLMAHLGLPHAHFIGHSMGGKVSMHLAVHHPEMVDKLVVVDIGPKQYQRGHDQIFKALFAIDPRQLNSRTEAEEKMGLYIMEEGVIQFLLKNLVREADGGFRWRIALDHIFENYDNIIEAVESDWPYVKPVLFVRGAKSNYIPQEDYNAIRELFPNAQFEAISGAGHWVHAEAPVPFLHRIEHFLKGSA
jgi:esterase